jgi:hypothetical protein
MITYTRHKPLQTAHNAKQNYDELHTQIQNVTPINFSKEEPQISIPDRELSFLEGSQIIS